MFEKSQQCCRTFKEQVIGCKQSNLPQKLSFQKDLFFVQLLKKFSCKFIIEQHSLTQNVLIKMSSFKVWGFFKQSLFHDEIRSLQPQQLKCFLYRLTKVTLNQFQTTDKFLMKTFHRMKILKLHLESKFLQSHQEELICLLITRAFQNHQFESFEFVGKIDK